MVLIHGTFAPGAIWTHRDSPLIQKLQGHFAGIRVMFQPFDWPGLFGGRFNNSHFYRYAASRALLGLLDRLHGTFPRARVFLVAHSHGGNVALYAANATESTGVVHGIICMGTPFINLEPRMIDNDLPLFASIDALTGGAWAALLCCSSLLGVAGMLLGFLLLAGDGHGLIVRALGALVGLISFGIAIWYLEPDGTELIWVPDTSSGSAGSYKPTQKFKISDEAEKLRERWINALKRRLQAFATQKQSQLAAKLIARVPPKIPLLCLRTKTPDEALNALGLSDSVLGFPARLLGDGRFSAILAALLIGGSALTGLAVPISMLVDFFHQHWHEPEFSIGEMFGTILASVFLGVLTFLLVGMVVIVLLYVLAPISVVVRAALFAPSLLAYGSSDLFAEYVCTTSVRSEPIGWEAAERPASVLYEYDFADGSGLRHSQYCTDPRCLQDIAQWLCARYDEASVRSASASPANVENAF